MYTSLTFFSLFLYVEWCSEYEARWEDPKQLQKKADDFMIEFDKRKHEVESIYFLSTHFAVSPRIMIIIYHTCIARVSNMYLCSVLERKKENKRMLRRVRYENRQLYCNCEGCERDV